MKVWYLRISIRDRSFDECQCNLKELPRKSAISSCSQWSFCRGMRGSSQSAMISCGMYLGNRSWHSDCFFMFYIILKVIQCFNSYFKYFCKLCTYIFFLSWITLFVINKKIIIIIFIRAVAKTSSCRVYAISRREIVQLGISLGSVFLLFPMKVAGAHAHSNWGKSPAPGS